MPPSLNSGMYEAYSAAFSLMLSWMTLGRAAVLGASSVADMVLGVLVEVGKAGGAHSGGIVAIQIRITINYIIYHDGKRNNFNS